ncbi:MAG TPA: ATP-binding protein [Kamptonema sp.]|nr:ATP-binding protein [Kamptonema sp.]
MGTLAQEDLAVVVKNLFTGGGEMGALMRSYDWSKTPFGPVEQWPQSLRSTLSICLNSRFPIAIYWGSDCLLLYNDAWRPIVGDKHPWSLGYPGREVWPEIWSEIGPEFESVFTTGEGIFHSDELLAMHRFGYTEECFFDYTFNPIQGEGGGIDGILNIVSETTYRVLNDRRAQLLGEVASKTGTAKTTEEAYKLMAEALRSDPADIPFSLLYLIDLEKGYAHLCSGTQFGWDEHIAPPMVDLNAGDRPNGWPIARSVCTGQPQQIDDLVTRFGTLPGSPWPEPPQEAMVLPIAATGQAKISGVLVAVASPRRRLDDRYRDFLNQITGQIASAIANAHSYEEERRRAEQLAELDRAKTVFFSNVSHEFRTPLTLMLGPVEEALQATQDVEQRDRLELIHRNALRLQKLVNTLLDFSRIEAGRIEAVYQPTDLAMLTTELAGVFESAIARAGLHFQVDCPPLPKPVYVDREMWEKIVLNLLSNAFKYTFEGEIAVILRSRNEQIELEVRDTGIGIPAAELPQIFERFHRVQGARGRTYEGSGIGLSLVQELVRLHGGTISASSIVDRGTSFIVSIPTGCDRLPSDRINATRTLTSTATGATPYVEEVLRWLPEPDLGLPTLDARSVNSDSGLEKPQLGSPTDSWQAQIPNPKFKIVLADDNADMRNYVKRLLNQQYEVEAVKDGAAALAAIRQQLPDLVLTDVMMPELDGFELLRELRANPQTKELPIILLSARAGEESRIEGLEAGADDYLIKPFSARELLARVEANLKMAQLRQEATQREQVQRQVAEKAKEQLESVLSSISDQFLVLDREWRYLYVNDRVIETVGLERETLLGRSVWEVFPEVVGTEFDTRIQQAIAQQVPAHFEYYYSTWNRWFENHAYPSPEGVTIFMTEITDRKRAEQEREHLLAREQAARAEAERANRVKDEFLAIVSHELRSPLNPILGWSTLLQTQKLNPAKTAQALSAIVRNARLQAELIDDLLDLSRILRGKLSLNVLPTDLVSTIQSAMETVRLAAEVKLIELHARFEPNIGLVLGDSSRLQQVVWNLLSNAIKFTPEGGRVDIRLEQCGAIAQIIVSDTGKGIDPDFLPYIFEYFRQENSATTRKFGGLGLGLAIVHHLVELHGGTVEAESPGEGRGATFTVKLPLMLSSSQISPDSKPSEPALDLAGIQVLVVDDNDDTREFIVFLIEQYGGSAIAVASADRALVALTQFQPDVLLSDIGMPEVDGYMLIQQVRALPPEQGGQIPAIALTAYAGEIDYKQAMSVGFQRHIPKPVEPAKLLEVILSLVIARD